MTRYGATPDDWSHFDIILGVGEDLLPVVSNPDAVISSQSKMAALGKTPSRYNGKREVGGFPKWTEYRATSKDLDKWAKEPDYGIALQTRSIRAIDCDINDAGQAKEIHELLERLLLPALPTRRRGSSPKFLCPITLPDGAYTKRTVKTAHGIIEFLADGQQFIAVGTHPSGSRYEWDGGLPTAIPQLTAEQFESLWQELVNRFAIEAPSERKTTSKAEALSAAVATDPITQHLIASGRALGTERDGRVHITCPFEDEHTGDTGQSSTTYWPPHTGGFELGNFRCLHAHCEHRTRRDFLEALGLVEDPRDDFDAVVIADDADGHITENKVRFSFLPANEFSAGKPISWFVKGILPRAPLGVVFGPPGAGKSFWATDLAAAIARGVDAWCGKRVHKARVGFVAAEGAAGFRNRLQAYASHHGLDLADLPLFVMAAAPNLMQKADVVDLGNAINRAGGLDLVVYDTLARGTAGADENSARDMGVAIDNCRILHEVTGATILLVHHSGKDVTKGARGSNALLGAVDVEIEISRLDNNRTATVSKLKDGEDGAQFGFVLKTVSIGMDEDGDVVSSCVVEHGEAVQRKPREKKMGPWEECVWRVTLELQGVDGPPSVAAVVDAASESMPFDDKSGKRDNRRYQANRALESLCSKERLSVVGGRVIAGEQT